MGESGRNRREAGASLVEFALLAPVLFALLLGMITGGLSLSRKNSMENAVREGARFGATLNEDSSWSSDVRKCRRP
ncbi:MAG: TadE family protein [Acidimicrobiia bacterium]